MSENIPENTPENTVPEEHKRSIRSFVLRQGHMTAAQQRAIDTMWPQFGVDFQEAPLDLNRAFGRDNPKVLEIGFGMGVATVEIAKRLPDTDFLAIDVHGPGVGNILKLIEEEHISNIRVMRHDAVEVVEKMLEDGSLDGIHIFFPDPWHKNATTNAAWYKCLLLKSCCPNSKAAAMSIWRPTGKNTPCKCWKF